MLELRDGADIMKLLFRLPIRFQLILIVIIVALPAVGIIINAGIQQRREAINAARIETQKLADRIAFEQQSKTASAHQIMVLLSHLTEIITKNPTKTTHLLREIHNSNPDFSNISVADRSGNVWASAVPTQRPFSISDRRHFINTLASGQLSSGEFIISRSAHKPSFTLGYPIKDEHGTIIGVISVGFLLEKYTQLLEKSRLPNNASMVLLDHKGVILFRTIEPEKYIGKQSDPALFQQILDGPDENTSIGVSLAAGDERIISSRKLSLEGESSAYMYVRVGIPVESALSHANSELLRNLVLFSWVLVLALLFSSFIGERSIVSRIELLEKASQRLANGESQIKVSDLVKGGELGRLADSFDSMANKLILREEALAGSERFLDTIINTEPECVKMLAADGTLLSMNRAGLNMLEADSLNQLKGKCIYPCIAEEYREAFITLTNSVFQGESGFIEFKAVGLKGRSIWLETHAVPFRNETGAVVSLLAITRDITERKDTEAENAQLTEQLLQSQKIESIGRLTGGIAHDFNNLLTPIIGYTELLKNCLSHGSSGFNKIDKILQAAEGAKVLVQQLLSFSRKQILDIKSIDVNTVISSFYEILRRTIRENIDIQLALTPDSCVIRADKHQLEQIIMNLVVNAQDAISNTGLITIVTGQVIIDHEYARQHANVTPGRYFMLTITDNGCGMDKKTQEQIFEPFFTTKAVGEGTGLGLATVYGLVKQQGGNIWVYSEPGKGTAFKIYFPIVDEAPDDSTTDKPEQPFIIKRGLYTILLVEDNDMVRNMVFEFLSDLGFDVIVAEGPKQALVKADGRIIDLLMTDVVMPDMTGPELHKRLARKIPGLQALFMSGYTNNVISHHGVINDGCNFISKPFSVSELSQKLQSVFNS